MALRKIVLVLATVFLIIIALSIGTFAAEQQSNRERTRTVNVRQFRTGADWWEHDLRVFRRFEDSHHLNLEADDGLRLALNEWPSWNYLISISVNRDGSSKGAIRAEPNDRKNLRYEGTFLLDAQETRLFFSAWDHETSGYLGATVQCVDGTGFQFERWQNRRVSSGRGNAACHRHYAELMSLIAENLATKLTDPPFDWRSWFMAKRTLDLSGSGS